MTPLMDFTQGKRVHLADLTFDSGEIACVIHANKVIHLTPPCPSTNELSFLFINGEEVQRFLLLDAESGLWLNDTGCVLTDEDMSDLPLKVAMEEEGGREEFLRKLDS